jgi:hypothetical protein
MKAEGAYKVLKEVLGLRHIKDNIFEDQEGKKFYLDRYGFHTAIQVANLSLEKVQQMQGQAKQAKDNAENMKRQYKAMQVDILGKKSKKYLNSLLNNGRYTAQEKVKIAIEYLSNGKYRD